MDSFYEAAWRFLVSVVAPDSIGAEALRLEASGRNLASSMPPPDHAPTTRTTASHADQTLRPGDLILVCTRGVFYGSFRALTHHTFDHVAVVLDDNLVLHVGPPRVRKLPLGILMHPKRRPLVLRPAFESLAVRRRFLHHLDQAVGCEYDSLGVYRFVAQLARYPRDPPPLQLTAEEQREVIRMVKGRGDGEEVTADGHSEQREVRDSAVAQSELMGPREGKDAAGVMSTEQREVNDGGETTGISGDDDGSSSESQGPLAESQGPRAPSVSVTSHGKPRAHICTDAILCSLLAVSPRFQNACRHLLPRPAGKRLFARKSKRTPHRSVSASDRDRGTGIATEQGSSGPGSELWDKCVPASACKEFDRCNFGRWSINDILTLRYHLPHLLKFVPLRDSLGHEAGLSNMRDSQDAADSNNNRTSDNNREATHTPSTAPASSVTERLTGWFRRGRLFTRRRANGERKTPRHGFVGIIDPQAAANDKKKGTATGDNASHSVVYYLRHGDPMLRSRLRNRLLSIYGHTLRIFTSDSGTSRMLEWLHKWDQKVRSRRRRRPKPGTPSTTTTTTTTAAASLSGQSDTHTTIRRWWSSPDGTPAVAVRRVKHSLRQRSDQLQRTFRRVSRRALPSWLVKAMSHTHTEHRQGSRQGWAGLLPESRWQRVALSVPLGYTALWMLQWFVRYTVYGYLRRRTVFKLVLLYVVLFRLRWLERVGAHPAQLAAHLPASWRGKVGGQVESMVKRPIARRAARVLSSALGVPLQVVPAVAVPQSVPGASVSTGGDGTATRTGISQEEYAAMRRQHERQSQGQSSAHHHPSALPEVQGWQPLLVTTQPAKGSMADVGNDGVFSNNSSGGGSGGGGMASGGVTSGENHASHIGVSSGTVDSSETDQGTASTLCNSSNTASSLNHAATTPFVHGLASSTRRAGRQVADAFNRARVAVHMMGQQVRRAHRRTRGLLRSRL